MKICWRLVLLDEWQDAGGVKMEDEQCSSSKPSLHPQLSYTVKLWSDLNFSIKSFIVDWVYEDSSTAVALVGWLFFNNKVV